MNVARLKPCPSSRDVFPSGRHRRSSLCSLHYRRVKPMGAPGLAFETWDPSNQFPLEIPTLLFIIPSVPKEHRMNELLSLAVEAHGGLERWNKVKSIKVEASITGAIWYLK